MKYAYSTSDRRKTSKSAHVTVEGRKMGDSSELPSVASAIPLIEKVAAKKSLRWTRAWIDTL